MKYNLGFYILFETEVTLHIVSTKIIVGGLSQYDLDFECILFTSLICSHAQDVLDAHVLQLA